MVSRRSLLRTLGVGGVTGLAGCNLFTVTTESGTSTPPEATPTATLTPTASAAATDAPTPTDSPTSTDSPTPTDSSTPTSTPSPMLAEAVGTGAMTPGEGVDEFGRAVALSESLAVVLGETAGAHVFERGSTGWTQSAVLTPTDDEDFGGYRTNVTLSGDVAYVGAPGTEDEGAVYVFERVGEEWTQRARVTPDDADDADGDFYDFGASVAVDDGTLVVGAVNQPSPQVEYSGAAFVFERESDDWSQVTRVGTEGPDAFGLSVALDGETAIIGAPYESGDTGKWSGVAYVYRETSDGWSREARLTPATETPDRCGQSVALDGDTAVLGAPGYGPGHVVVFERTDGGWHHAATVAGRGEEAGDFGHSVALKGDTAVVTAPRDSDAGTATVLERSDGAWRPTTRLVPADLSTDAEFGDDVSLAAGRALVGAPDFDTPSAAYLYDV